MLLVLIFVPQGWARFNDGSGWAGALLVLGRTAAFGALLIIVVMLGGMATHVIFDNRRHLTSEVVPAEAARQSRNPAR